MMRSTAVLLALGCAGPLPQPSPDAAPLAGSHGVLLVANQQSATATIVRLPEGKTTHVEVGVGPHETAIGADGRWGIVTVYGNQQEVGSRLAVVDLVSGTLVRHVSLGDYTRPHGVVVLPGPGRRVIVTSESSRHVVLVDVEAGTIEQAIATGAPGSHMVAVTRDGRRAFTANIPAGSISEFDLVGRRHVRSDSVATVTEGIAVTPDGGEVWVGSNDAGTVTVFDTRAGRVVATLDGFRMPYRVAISADGRVAAVPDPPAGVLHLLDVAGRRRVGTVAMDGSPRGVALSPDGRTAFVTLGPEGAVAVVDLATRTVTGRFAVGRSPDGVAFAPSR